MENSINLNPYKVTWVEFRATKGIVTKHDKRVMHVQGCTKHRFYKFFGSKQNAVDFLNDDLTKRDFAKLDKSYECRILTDKQYSLAKEENGYKIEFTEHQENEMIVINKK